MPNSTEIMIVHGHRGCRGTLPENSPEGFVHAAEIGADFLEMDVVCTRDNHILVSHDPFMHHEICVHPDLRPIEEHEESTLNIYRMTLEEVRQYPCGTQPHPRFVQQQQIPFRKPLLSEVSNGISEWARTNDRDLPGLNIEIKSREEWTGVMHPEPDEYTDLILDTLEQINWPETVLLQSFDPRILRELHKKSPSLKLAILAENAARTPAKYIDELGFIPYSFSPFHHLITDEVISSCEEYGMELIVWTVNDEKLMEDFFRSGIRHLITDYPHIALEVRKRLSATVISPSK